MKNFPLIDTFQFFGASDTPGLVDFRVEWEATGPTLAQGLGKAVPPTIRVRSSGSSHGRLDRSFAGQEIGFEFESNPGAVRPRGGRAARNGAERRISVPQDRRAEEPAFAGQRRES